VFIDDISVAPGEGSTSFEDDGNQMDGWTVPGPPPGSPANNNDFSIGGTADLPHPMGFNARGSLDRAPEILTFLSGQFGRYPFRDAGGIVDSEPGIGYALENQTRPIYAREFFGQPGSGDSVVVHELAHQWFGDSVSVATWRDIWLNEGFAQYAEWLWSEHEGTGTAQEIFDFYYDAFPADDPFWSLVISDPGPDALFAWPVYLRGAMALHQLRLAIGDEAFFKVLRRWAGCNRDGNGTLPAFQLLAERMSGKDLAALFSTWLSTPSKPAQPLASAPMLHGPAAGEVALRIAARERLSGPRP
jgi:aminopeptidase N